jgi:hypothetical protein
LRVPIFGSDELREERSVVMAPFALDALRRSIEHNQRMRLSGATLPGRIGLCTPLRRFLQTASQNRFNTGQKRFLLHLSGKARAMRR